MAFLLSIDNLNVHVKNYIVCSAGGLKEECEMHRKDAERSSKTASVLFHFSTTLLTFINLSHLVFVVNIPKVMRAIQKYVCTYIFVAK